MTTLTNTYIVSTKVPSHPRYAGIFSVAAIVTGDL